MQNRRCIKFTPPRLPLFCRLRGLGTRYWRPDNSENTRSRHNQNHRTALFESTEAQNSRSGWKDFTIGG